MKLASSLAFALALTVGFSACGGDDGDDGDGGANTMSASIAGASNFSVSGVLVQGSHNSNVLSFGGSDIQAPSRTIQIFVSDVTAPGTYTIGGIGNPGSSATVTITTLGGGGAQISTWTANAIVGSGSVTVTSIDEDGAKGTFTFTGSAAEGTSATGTKAVTNGKFNVTF